MPAPYKSRRLRKVLWVETFWFLAAQQWIKFYTLVFVRQPHKNFSCRHEWWKQTKSLALQSLPTALCECRCVKGMSTLPHLVCDSARDVLQGDLCCSRNMSQTTQLQTFTLPSKLSQERWQGTEAKGKLSGTAVPMGQANPWWEERAPLLLASGTRCLTGRNTQIRRWWLQGFVTLARQSLKQRMLVTSFDIPSKLCLFTLVTVTLQLEWTIALLN